MLSIVLPVLNEAKTLPTVLRSIKAQTYTDYEVIVSVSPATTDDSRAIAESFGARVVKGGLISAARNHGAAVAKGDIILFIDADIILPDPWFLQMTVAEFERRGLGSATCKVTPLSDRLIDKAMHEASNYFMWATQKMRPHAPGFCIFVRRSIFEAAGGFDETLLLAEDHDFVERASRLGKFALLKTYRLPVSVRRFDRDGRLNVAVKYLLIEFYLATVGPIRSDIFKYSFDHTGEAREKFGSPKWRLHAKKTALDAVNLVIEELTRSRSLVKSRPTNLPKRTKRVS